MSSLLRMAGGRCVFRAAGMDAFRAESGAEAKELLKKLDEEVAEYKESGETEELADILEVLLALAKAQGVSAEELQRICTEKRKARGGFAKRIFLIGKD